MRSFLILALVVTSTHGASTQAANPVRLKDLSPKARVIAAFYKGYMRKKPRDLEPPFSKAFKKLQLEDFKVCKEKAGTDICGWGADEDPFLKTQEGDPKLSFENMDFKIREPAENLVEISFDVYPSIKDAGDYYHRNIKFKMLKEDGKWVVDDMIYDGKSGVAEMKEEIASFEKPAGN